MLDFRALVFVGMLMQGIGTVFLTIQLWGYAWGLTSKLQLDNPRGNWIHIVRDGLLLVILGTAINILSVASWFISQ